MALTRNGQFSLLIPALVLVPLAGLAVWYLSLRWFDMDAEAAVKHRIADAAASAGLMLDDAVQRQAAATRALGTSPMVWLWVKFQGESLSPSNRSHAQMALNEAANYAALLPGVTLYLASERTRNVYQGGAAVSVLSRGDAGDSWYAACLRTEGVVISDDPRVLRTSMRVMNGQTLLGAVSCVGDLPAVADSALAIAAEEPGFSFALADGEGSIMLARGERAAAAANVFELFSPAEHGGIRATIDALGRPGAMTIEVFKGMGRRVLTAVTRTAAPGWYVFVLSDLPRLPIARGVLLAAVAAAALALLVAALLLLGLARTRETESVVGLLQRERDEAASLAREVGTAAQRLRAAAVTLRERVAVLMTEAAAAKTAGDDAAGLLARAEEGSAELRSGIAARLPLLAELASSARDAQGRSQEARSAAETAASSASAAEEGLNRVITTGSAVSLAVENADKEVDAVVEAAERARLLALNASLEASRSSGQGRAGLRMADDMRKMAEEAAEHAQALAAALGEARASMRVVGRTAQEAGKAVHDAAALSTESKRVLDAAWEGAEELLSRIEAAQASAVRLRDEAVSFDRGSSAVTGVSRIMKRIEALGADIAALAAAVSTDSTKAAQKSSESGLLGPQGKEIS